MKKNILKLIILLLFANLTISAYGYPPEPLQSNYSGRGDVLPKPRTKEIKQLDKMIEQRLNLTPEQIKILKTNKQKNIRELEKTIAKMENTRKKIRNIYLLGLPGYQEDLRSAPYKMELVLLKQNADVIRNRNRRTFEAILTPEQKVEFKKIKNELLSKQPAR